jgi:hypothetical protein
MKRVAAAASLALALLRTSSACADPTHDHGDRTGSEVGIVPLLGGSTDAGIGAGFLANVTVFAPGYTPNLMNVEVAAFLATKADGFSPAYQDYYLDASFALGDGLTRLQVRPSYTRETQLPYFGLGNGTEAPEDDAAYDRQIYDWARAGPTVRLRRWLGHDVEALTGLSYTQNLVRVAPETLLATQIRDTDGAGSLDVEGNHGLVWFEAGLGYDTRDNEVTTSSGHHHAFRLRASPRIGSAIPYEFLRASLILRGYVPLFDGRVVFAARVVGDVLLGDAPLYELGRIDDSPAIGGARGVRGVPAYRYYGDAKVLGNLELRGDLWRFEVADKPYALGAVGFFDGGRVWMMSDDLPQVDSQGLGLKFGFGGGLRLQQGAAFVVRADLAWSPDARPVSAYLTARHIF